MSQIHVHNYETSGQITVVFCICLFSAVSYKGKLFRHESQTGRYFKNDPRSWLGAIYVWV